MEDLDSFLNEIPLTAKGDEGLETSHAEITPAFSSEIFENHSLIQRSTSEIVDEKKRKQLERNRETAKRCRRRKREKIDALMEEVVRLRETNKDLEVQLKVCKSKLGDTKSGRGNRGTEEEKRRVAEMKRIREMIQQKCSEDEIALRVETLIELYSDYGEERQKVLKTQIAHLRGIMLPTKISKMLLWFLEQDDTFFQTSEIWQTLLQVMNIDSDQEEKFLKQRNSLGQQNVGFKQMIRRLENLESEILDNMQMRAKEMTEITSIFTPMQQAKFLDWVENNEACVQLLDTLWKQRTKPQVKPE